MNQTHKISNAMIIPMVIAIKSKIQLYEKIEIKGKIREVCFHEEDDTLNNLIEHFNIIVEKDQYDLSNLIGKCCIINESNNGKSIIEKIFNCN